MRYTRIWMYIMMIYFRDTDNAIVRPLPKIKRLLSDSYCLAHVVQVLLTFDPVLVEKVAVLLCEVMQDNPEISKLYLTGMFYFILMYTGSNVLPIARFLQLTHMKQAFRTEDVSFILNIAQNWTYRYICVHVLDLIRHHATIDSRPTFARSDGMLFTKSRCREICSNIPRRIRYARSHLECRDETNADLESLCAHRRFYSSLKSSYRRSIFLSGNPGR